MNQTFPTPTKEIQSTQKCIIKFKKKLIIAMVKKPEELSAKEKNIKT